ncbi:MAG: zinc ribbon domain-containing protein [Spirochaetes bacterium]|nr:zinc ribbon domain-containing protein [Spirochaetota bacterium]
MPTYDYECTECKHRFEMFQSMKDDPIEKCIKCGGKVKKLIGAGAGIIFKGSGFYVNDYKKGSSNSSGSSKKVPSAAPAGSTVPPPSESASKALD